jgi:hypothetical protein
MADFSCGDVVAVPDEAVLWRAEKVSDNHIWWSDELGRWVPRLPNAIVFNKELSTFWSQHLEIVHDGQPQDITIVREGPAVVFGCTAGQLRALSLTVVHEPADGIPTPPACAHVLASYPGDSTKREKNRFRSEIVRLMTHDAASGEITLTRPPN